jgi:hypothetical protein
MALPDSNREQTARRRGAGFFDLWPQVELHPVALDLEADPKLILILISRALSPIP